MRPDIDIPVVSGLPSHEGSGLKSLVGARAVSRRSLPSHEGSGLKLIIKRPPSKFKGLPSHEGSGLKSPLRAIYFLCVSPRMRGVD